MAYIISELDELEREEFYRLKKVQDKKKKIKKEKDDAAVRNMGRYIRTDLNNFIFLRLQGELLDLMMMMELETYSMKNMTKICYSKYGSEYYLIYTFYT